MKSVGLLVLRVGAGLMMAFAHGWGKMIKFQEIAPRFPDPIGLGSHFSLGLAVFAEFFCSLLVVVGLFTRFAALNVVVTMLVAAFVIHAADPFAKKELALLYLLAVSYTHLTLPTT